MKTQEVRPSTGTLPGYLPLSEVEKYAGFAIGNRQITVIEEADMRLLGLDREGIAGMTPEDLHEMAGGHMNVSESL